MIWYIEDLLIFTRLRDMFINLFEFENLKVNNWSIYIELLLAKVVQWKLLKILHPVINHVGLVTLYGKLNISAQKLTKKIFLRQNQTLAGSHLK